MAIQLAFSISLEMYGDGTSTTKEIDLTPYIAQLPVVGIAPNFISINNGATAVLSGTLLTITFANAFSGFGGFTVYIGF
jgi:hypothetical protein